MEEAKDEQTAKPEHDIVQTYSRSASEKAADADMSIAWHDVKLV